MNIKINSCDSWVSSNWDLETFIQDGQAYPHTSCLAQERSRQTQCEEDLHRKFTKNLPRLDFKRSPFVSQPTAFLQISTFDPAWWVLKHNLFKDPVRLKVYCRWPLKSTSNTLELPWNQPGFKRCVLPFPWYRSQHKGTTDVDCLERYRPWGPPREASQKHVTNISVE